jgi:two-component system, OmpR family, sensor kinase
VRNRITFAFVAVLASALFVAGLASLLLVRHAVSISAQHSVLTDAEAVQSALHNPAIASAIASPAGLALVKSIAGLNDTEIVLVGPKGRLIPTPQPGSIKSFVNGKKLLAGLASSGVHNHIVFGAVPTYSPTPGEVVGILFSTTEDFHADSLWYFLLATAVALLGAALVASIVSSRIAARVRVVADASDQIASGDLSTRVPVLGEIYPELAQLETAINTMAEALEQSGEGEKSFLLAISHDLRTPLTSIRGYAEAIADDAVTDLPAAAGVVISEARRLDRLIGDLLDLARLRAHQFSFNVVPFDLVALVTSSVDAFRLQFSQLDIALKMESDAPRWPTIGDPDRFGQVLANLLENAMKYAEHEVAVGMVITDDAVTVTVADDGPGIDAEDLPFVFDRLYSSSRHVARAAGTGLGLAIVTELCAAMDAEVTVTSPTPPTSASRGTRFNVVIHQRARATAEV